MPARTSGRSPFDAVAECYDRVRPGYPDDAVDDLLALAHVPKRGRVLEIGAGTGQLTVSLAERGHRITAIEVGPHLAQRLRRNVEDYETVEVVTGRFEEIDRSTRSYDLVAAATAFHWLDQEVAFPRAAALLRPTGSLGILVNAHEDRDQGFHREAESVYERIAPELAGRTSPSPDTAGQWRDRLGETGLFGEVEIRHHRWSASYDRPTYLDLLSTYSDHIALSPDVRERLFAELGRLIDGGFRGRVEKQYDAVVVVAPVRPERAG